MNFKQAILLIMIVCLVPGITSAIDTAFGNVSGNYTYQSGDNTVKINTNIPLTMEDTAFPSSIFYFFAILGTVLLAVGIVLTAKSDSIPSLAITACGLVSMGAFFMCAVMAPYVATHAVISQIVSGVIYVTEVNTYLFSPWVGYAMWGGAVAGLIVFILGGLSFIGWFHRKGIKDAQRGKYIETDVEGDEQEKIGYRRRY